MNYRCRSSPGETEVFKPQPDVMPQGPSACQAVAGEELEEPSVPTLLGTLMWVAGRSRPDISWAVSRVSMAASDILTPEEVEDKARGQIKHILQYLRHSLDQVLVYVPIAKDSSSLLWASGDASLAPSGGKSHEGSVILHGI
eukprot:2924441-Amphidinium_carterae.1